MPTNDHGLSLMEQARAGRQAQLNTLQGPAYEAALSNSLNESPAWAGFFQALKNKQNVAGEAGMGFRTNIRPDAPDPLEARTYLSPLDTQDDTAASPLNTQYRTPAVAGLYSAQAQRGL